MEEHIHYSFSGVRFLKLFGPTEYFRQVIGLSVGSRVLQKDVCKSTFFLPSSVKVIGQILGYDDPPNCVEWILVVCGVPLPKIQYVILVADSKCLVGKPSFKFPNISLSVL